MLIGLAIFFVTFGIGSAIHVMKKYPQELIEHDGWNEDSMVAVLPFDDEDVVLDDVMDDD